MSITHVRSAAAIRPLRKRSVDSGLEVVMVPVAEFDRAKRVYGGLGWRLDADLVNGDACRVVQYTPPCSL
jgi:hypothetical protein